MRRVTACRANLFDGFEVQCNVERRAREYFRAQLRHVKVSLGDGRRYLMGDRFTNADILFDDLPGLGHRVWRRCL